MLDTPQPLTDVLYEGFLSQAVADLIIDSVSQSSGIVSINYRLSKP